MIFGDNRALRISRGDIIQKDIYSFFNHKARQCLLLISFLSRYVAKHRRLQREMRSAEIHSAAKSELVRRKPAESADVLRNINHYI